MSSNNFPHAFFNKKITKTTEANLPIMTTCIQYGTALIGGIRGYFNKKTGTVHLFRVDDHLQRFLSSVKLVGCVIPYDFDELKKIVIELVKKNKPQTDIYLRPFAYASSFSLQPNFEKDKELGFCLYMISLGEYLPLDKGLSVMISAWRRISDNAVPSRGKLSGGYICSAMATADAVKRGFDEAVMLTENGHVAEGAAENIFIVRNGVLITPSKSEEILEGITRRTILKLAKDLKIPTEERPIDRTELYICDEAFFTGTGAQVSWIGAVDGRPVGKGKIGPITTKLRDLFFKIVHGEEKKYTKFLTSIKIS